MLLRDGDFPLGLGQIRGQGFGDILRNQILPIIPTSHKNNINQLIKNYCLCAYVPDHVTVLALKSF